MNRYRAYVTDRRGSILFQSDEFERFENVLVAAAVLQEEYPNRDVWVNNLDNFDYDCADGLTRAEREMVEEIVS